MRHSSSYRIARAETDLADSTTIAETLPADASAIARALFPLGTPDSATFAATSGAITTIAKDLLAATLLGVTPHTAVTAATPPADGRHPQHSPATNTDSECVATRTFGERAHAALDPVEPLVPVAQRQSLPRRGARTIVRLIGIALLIAALTLVVGYGATVAFYSASDSWIVPTIVSPHDARVVALRGELAQRSSQRDQLAAELADTERAIAEHQTFQIELAKAVRAELAGKRSTLSRVRALAAAARDELGNRDAGDPTLAQRELELRRLANQLAAETAGLAAILAGDRSKIVLGVDAVRIQREYDQSRRALAFALERRDALAITIAHTDEAITALRQTAPLRALADRAPVAVVPYASVATISPGAPVYSCRVAMLFCHRVGSVLELLPGEVTFAHPHRDRQLRGRMIELSLSEPAALDQQVLFVGGAPLGL